MLKNQSNSTKIVSIVEKLAKKTNPEKIKDKEELERKIKKLLPEYTEDARYERFLSLANFEKVN